MTNFFSKLKTADDTLELFIASSPPEFCTPHRTGDLDSLLYAINEATKTICIEVMDYSASSLYYSQNYFWPSIADALMNAAYTRNVKVKFLISKWPYTIPSTLQFAKALNSIANIEVRFMVIPSISGGSDRTFFNTFFTRI